MGSATNEKSVLKKETNIKKNEANNSKNKYLKKRISLSESLISLWKIFIPKKSPHK